MIIQEETICIGLKVFKKQEQHYIFFWEENKLNVYNVNMVLIHEYTNTSQTSVVIVL